MRVDESFFENREDGVNYAAGIILPDGDYELVKEGHLHRLMELVGDAPEKIWEQVPEGDSALFWLVEHTRCVVTDENTTIGMKMTPTQEHVFRLLVAHGVIADKYVDLSEERSRAHARYDK